MKSKFEEVIELRKIHYKQLLNSMPKEDKKIYLVDLPEEDLIFISEQFVVDEDYEICQAIKEVLEERGYFL